MSCYCQSCYPNPCSCTYNPCVVEAGCPVQLDADCVIYHKANNELSELTGLGLTNGSTLELILEALDDRITDLNVINFTLPCLRVGYVVNTLQQFAQAVDTELCLIKTDLTATAALVNTGLVVNDSSTIDFNTSGTLNHTLTGSVRVSATANNQLSAQIDGLFSAPQTLSINYTTKELSISSGNTLSLASLVCGASGFLGNLAADPTSVDGQYWYNTTSNQLKIKVNGSVRQIQII